MRKVGRWQAHAFAALGLLIMWLVAIIVDAVIAHDTPHRIVTLAELTVATGAVAWAVRHAGRLAAGTILPGALVLASIALGVVAAHIGWPAAAADTDAVIAIGCAAAFAGLAGPVPRAPDLRRPRLSRLLDERGRVLARPISTRDAATLAEWSPDRGTQRWFGLDEPWTVEQAVEWIRRVRANANNVLTLAIVRDQRMIGIGQVWNVTRSVAELGIVIAPQHRGSGVASVWVTRIVEHLFRHGCHRVQVHVDPTNTASIRLWRKLGFTRECVQSDWGGPGVDQEAWFLLPERGSSSRPQHT